jgi:hypothetical protein
MNYRCHNCGAGRTLGTFLKEFDPSLYKQYIFERFASGENGHSNYEKPDEGAQFKESIAKMKILTRPKELENLQSIRSLPDEHYAKVYISDRLIPTKYWSRIFYTPDFKEFIDKLVPGKYDNLKPNDERLIIPFFDKDGKLVVVQGRALGESKLRYITIKLVEEAQKIFGLDRVNFDEDYYITEGPIDSMFIPNSIAMAGADVSLNDLPRNGVFIFDNERENAGIIDRMKKVIQMGFSIFIWPNTYPYKDVNDAILNGVTPEEFLETVVKRTYSGVKATAMIIKWSNVNR